MKIKIQSKKSLLEKEEIEVKIFYDELDKYYTINAYSLRGDIACSATIKPRVSPRQMWLNKIETKQGHQHKGYANAVINVIEYLTYNLRYNWIEGKYYPENEYAKPFYDKHGYTIYKDDYETYVTKTLDYDEIKEIEQNITGYRIEPQQDMER